MWCSSAEEPWLPAVSLIARESLPRLVLPQSCMFGNANPPIFSAFSGYSASVPSEKPWNDSFGELGFAGAVVATQQEDLA
jgi:hypothetical protein